MPRHAPRIDDPALRAVLDEALQRGALSLPHACKVLRAREGLTQAELAARARVAIKVVKELENATGNPTLDSLNRIASLAGLQVGLVKPRAIVKLGTAQELGRRQSKARRVSLRAVRRGKSTLKRHHASNALRSDGFTIELPKMRKS